MEARLTWTNEFQGSHFLIDQDTNLLAVIGSGIFFSIELNPGKSFSFLLAQPYQLDIATSPDPLPGIITAFEAFIWIFFW